MEDIQDLLNRQNYLINNKNKNEKKHTFELLLLSNKIAKNIEYAREKVLNNLDSEYSESIMKNGGFISKQARYYKNNSGNNNGSSGISLSNLNKNQSIPGGTESLFSKSGSNNPISRQSLGNNNTDDFVLREQVLDLQDDLQELRMIYIDKLADDLGIENETVEENNLNNDDNKSINNDDNENINNNDNNTIDNNGTTLIGTSPADIEQRLERHKQIQNDISGELLRMAKSLKSSSLAFAEQLDVDKSIIESASTALNKNLDNIQSTGSMLSSYSSSSSSPSWKLYIGSTLFMILVLLFSILIIRLFPKWI